MGSEVHYLLELSINPGKLNEFKMLMAEMIAATEKEKGTVAYEWCFSADGKTCNNYERFTNSEALLIHLRNFNKNFSTRFLAAIRPTKLTVLGHPNEDAKAALSGFSPIYLTTEAGFARFAT